MYGAEGLLSYPFSTFSRIDAGARLMGVSRTFFDNFAYDRFGSPTANIPAAELNDIRGSDPEAELTLAYGWDTTPYGPGGGLGGPSFLPPGGAGGFPTPGAHGPFRVW